LGKNFPRYYEATPQNAGNLTIKHILRDDNYKILSEKNGTFKVSARPSTSPGTTKKILCVGASTTVGGEWPAELKRRLTGTRDSGTPGADGLSNIEFVGRKDGTVNSTVKVEATGGWSWASFYTPRDAIRFTVSGVSSVNKGTRYTYAITGATIEVIVEEVNLTAGAGTIMCSFYTANQSTPESQSGTLTRNVGSGDDSIAFSAWVSETFCPFYDSDLGEPGFTDYVDEYCGGSVDYVIFFLGSVNKGIYGDASFNLNDMKTMLDALHRDYPGAKAIIAPGMGYDTHYGVDYNYGAGSGLDQWSFLFGCFRYVQAVEDFIADANYSSWCFMANIFTETDVENVFPTTQRPVNTRMATPTETIGTNGQHPLEYGYLMVADSIYRCFVNVM
jgi:hypothetical protein